MAEWIEWYGYGTVGVPDIEEGEGSVEDVVSHHRDVHKAIQKHGAEIQHKAEVNMHAHRDQGYFDIGRMYIQEGTKLDYHVYMVNPDPDTAKKAAISVLAFEYGHTRKDGTRVPGAWVLHDAAGLPHK